MPVIFVVSRGIKTTQKLDYDVDLFDLIKNDSYGMAKVEYGQGDDTVPTFSSIMPALKWAYEFDNEVTNSKPVKIVDYCSFVNEKYNPFDITDGDKQYKITKNGFFGIQCDCISSKSQS